MLANFHTHTTFSDGKNTAEETVLCALEKGFCSLGFSDHGYTEYDLRYCMRDESGYLAEIKRLKEKYKNQIQIYLGTEEDSHALVNRDNYEYIVGSCHYIEKDGKCYPFDSRYEFFNECLELFGGDEMALAESYYSHFCEYIKKRKPDIVGHFDLITKFDEKQKDRFLHNEKYWERAEKYLENAAQSGCIFEVNTGLITRGHRTSPCPNERLLRVLKRSGARVTLSSDSHAVENLDGWFTQAKELLREVGFDGFYVLYDNEWKKISLK